MCLGMRTIHDCTNRGVVGKCDLAAGELQAAAKYGTRARQLMRRHHSEATVGEYVAPRLTTAPIHVHQRAPAAESRLPRVGMGGPRGPSKGRRVGPKLRTSRTGAKGRAGVCRRDGSRRRCAGGSYYVCL